jgi:hypothetical protein
MFVQGQPFELADFVLIRGTDAQVANRSVIRLHGTEGSDDSLGADDPVPLCTHLSSYVAS